MSTHIDLSTTFDLQSAIESRWADGEREFTLTGTYRQETPAYAVLHIHRQLTGIALSGVKAGLDGQRYASHILAIQDAEADIRDLDICSGDTTRPYKVAGLYAGDKLRSVREAFDGAGALLLGASSVRFTNVGFKFNHSGMGGGAVSHQAIGLVEMVDCVFSNNSSYHEGAAISILGPHARMRVHHSQFNGNRSDENPYNPGYNSGVHGQVSALNGAYATITNCRFIGGSRPIDAAKGSEVQINDNHSSLDSAYFFQPVYQPVESVPQANRAASKERLAHARRLLAIRWELAMNGLYPWAEL